LKGKIRKCESGCYSMKSECCGAETKTAHPPRYSPNDKAAKYRRKNL